MFVLSGPVLIIGRAKSGEAVAELLRASYPNVELSFYDDKKELSDFASPGELLQRKWAHVVLSPGYPDQAWFRDLEKAGSVFTQELDVAAAYLDNEKVYAITGSVGKSTCVWVAAEVLRILGRKAFLGGNFGIPLAQYALEKVKNHTTAEFVILELSSFQIERMAFMVDRALLLNLLPNHLDRYADLDSYYAAKIRLLEFCREGMWAIKPGGDLATFAESRGITGKLKWIDVKLHEHLFEHSNLIGAHNRANLAAILEFLASPLLDESKVAEALGDVEPLPHRLEVFIKRGITFVNDSKATTVESVLTAYSALREKFESEKIFWLLGGRDKKLPWQRLKRLWTDKNLSFIFFGESAEMIKNDTGFEGEVFPQLANALEYLQGKLLAGDVLVLSPGGTSLDEFKSFEARGEFFKSFAFSKL